MVTISELKPMMKNVNIEVTLKEKGDVREFERFGKKGRVCSATATDDTGEVQLTLWNEQIDLVKEGDKIKITDGYVNEFQGKMQLQSGKMCKLEVIS